LIAFLDSQAIMDQTKITEPMMPNFSANSSLEKLLKAWGIQFDTTKVAADMNFATRFQRNNRQETAPAVLSLNQAGISKGDIVTEQLDSLLIPFCGTFSAPRPKA